MAVPWENFYTHVQPHVPGCPEIIIDNHIRDAAISFCERAEVWKYRTELLQTEAGISDYMLYVPSGSTLENVVSLHVDGSLALRISDVYSEQNPTQPEGLPLRYAAFEDRQIRFFPTPDRAYDVLATVVVKPSLTSTGIPNFIFETHAQAISYGALASLTVIPGKEWTNVELAAYYSAKFARAADDAKGRDTRRSNTRIRGPRFA